jgi:bifunctional non-homologous end joining protein LigD
MPAATVLDGELVALGADMACDFDAVRRRVQSDGRRGRPLTLVAFDLLWLDGNPLMGLALSKRKAALRSLLEQGNDHPSIALSQIFEDGQGLFAAVERMGHEGIVSKWRWSTYQAGKRSKRWLKVKTDAGKAMQAARSEAWYPAAGAEQ